MKFRKPLELIHLVDGINEYYSIYIFQNGAGEYKFKTIKAVTVAVFESSDRENDIYPPAGVSVCSSLDEFDVNIGLTKAMGRALARDAYTMFPFAEPELNLNEAITLAIKTAKRIDRRNMKRGDGRDMVKMKFRKPVELKYEKEGVL